MYNNCPGRALSHVVLVGSFLVGFQTVKVARWQKRDSILDVISVHYYSSLHSESVCSLILCGSSRQRFFHIRLC